MSCSEIQEEFKAVDLIPNEKLLAEIGKLRNQVEIQKGVMSDCSDELDKCLNKLIYIAHFDKEKTDYIGLNLNKIIKL